MNIFQPASILLPQQTSYEKWAVCAPDQHISNPAYWEHVHRLTDGFPSVMHMMIPDASLNHPRTGDRIRYARETMQSYLNDGRFRHFDNAYIYVERVLKNGAIRSGLIGAVDLEAYDYRQNSLSLIRPAERVDAEHFQSRLQLRKEAILEFPDVQLLCDDSQKQLIEPFSKLKSELPILYDFNLMENGGHITAWLVQGEHAAAFDQRLSHYAANYRDKYKSVEGSPMLFVVGGGNLSLAVAKKHYDDCKKANPEKDLSGSPCRYALVELENLYSPAIHLNCMHRVVTGTSEKSLLTMLQHYTQMNGRPVEWLINCEHGILYLDRARGNRSVDILQEFLDDYLGEHPGKLDYVNGYQNVEEMVFQQNSIGFLLPAILKEAFFPELITRGLFPRRSFTLCEPNEVRYCLEGRYIKD